MQAQGGHDVVAHLRRSRRSERHEWHATEGLAQLPQASIFQPKVVAPCANRAPAWPCVMRRDYLCSASGPTRQKCRPAGANACKPRDAHSLTQCASSTATKHSLQRSRSSCSRGTALAASSGVTYTKLQRQGAASAQATLLFAREASPLHWGTHLYLPAQASFVTTWLCCADPRKHADSPRAFRARTCSCSCFWWEQVPRDKIYNTEALRDRHLVLHQRDEGRYYHGCLLRDERRDLVAQRLAGARRLIAAA